MDLGANTFRFYGRTYSGTDLWVSTSGFVTVGPGLPGPATNFERGMDAAAIAPLWADWATNEGPLDAVYARFDDTSGDGTPDRVVVEWNHLRAASGSNRRATFQAILQLNTGPAAGDITFQYPSIGVGGPSEPFSVSGIKDFGRPAPHALVVQHNDLANPFVASGRALVIRRVVAPAVVGRHLFYNNSAFDGRNPAANAGDDAAIATSTTAGVRGGAATHDQVSGYSRGINGVMIDVRGIPFGDLGADDFVFRKGTSADLASWTAAPVPQTVAIRRGAGTAGSDRVTLIWRDGAIRNTWLEVTVLANDRTGLSAPSVFYFGSLVGNTDSAGPPYPGEVAVSHGDLHGVRRARPARAAGVANAFDVNRDGLVNVLDEALVRANLGRTIPTFPLPPNEGPAVAPTPPLTTPLSRRRARYEAVAAPA